MYQQYTQVPIRGWQIHSTPAETYINSIHKFPLEAGKYILLPLKHIVCEVNTTTLGWQIHSTPTETYIHSILKLILRHWAGKYIQLPLKHIVCEVNTTTLGWQIHSTPTETYSMCM